MARIHLIAASLLVLGACSPAPAPAPVASASPEATASPAAVDHATMDHGASGQMAENKPPVSEPQPTVSKPVQAQPMQHPITLANFTLKDQAGKAHSLKDYANAKAVVLEIHNVGCPIVQKMTPALNQTVADYKGKDVVFLGLNPIIGDTPDKIGEMAKSFGMAIPILRDEKQDIARELKAHRAAEMYVIDPKTWNVVYRGPLDDRLSYGAEKPKADKFLLRDALEEFMAGKPVTVAEVETSGCLIAWDGPQPG